MVADLDSSRAARATTTADSERVSSTRVDASERRDIVELALATNTDVIVNACDPRFNPPIFEAAFEAGCHYLDMAMHLSVPHPTDPYNQIGQSLGAAQFAASDAWSERGLLALVGMGVEPGFSDVAARYASDHLFSVDPRDRRSRRQRLGHPRLRVRSDVQHLDDDRGMPQSADRLRTRAWLVHDGAVLGARDSSTSPKASVS